MEPKEKALALHAQKASCAQAILVAYADIAGLDEETAYRLGDGLGRGFGGTGNLCGALNAAGIIISAMNSGSLATIGTTKDNTMKEVAKFTETFTKQFKATDCYAIRAENVRTGYNCHTLVGECCTLLDAYMQERNGEKK